MPTGITAGILDGDITTFEQFVKRSVRAMGVAIHMRDEPMDKEYEDAIPSDYYKKEHKDALIELEKIKELTDEELLTERKTNLNDSIKDVYGYVAEKKKNLVVLKKMLAKIKDWKPPTTEHNGFKTFMTEQIESTIEYDGDVSYYEKEIKKLKKELKKNVSPTELRKEQILNVEDNIERYLMHYEKDVKGCKKANKWIKDLYTSLNNKIT